MNQMETIYSYSRAQALSDGVLVDVSEAAHAIGFKYPVAITNTLYGQWIEVPESLVSEGQSTKGRLNDLLMMLVFAIRTKKDISDCLHFQVAFQTQPEKQETVSVWATVAGGDSGEPVITIMLEGED